MSEIYCLNWDYNHSGDMERDAFHIPFSESDKASIIFLSSKYRDKLPERILFTSNFNLLPEIDYPLTDLGIPVLSDKMIDTLKKCGPFEVILTPVIMLDDTYLGNIFDSEKKLKSDVPFLDNYHAMTILNRENCFDWNNSLYEPSEINPEIPGFIKKMVLTYNESLPPIFRIKEAPSKLFVTRSAKEALENNNIKGCIFEEVETANS